MATKDIQDVAVTEAPLDVESAQEDTRKNTWWTRFWGTSELDIKERKFVRKVDIYLFSYVMLGSFIKSLDQKNTDNAFVSGMKEDLSMYGNEKNYLTTYFNIGVILGTVPAQLIQMKYIRPSIFIPACEFSWSVLVMAMAGAKNVETLYALRFFVGLFEACSFPGYSTLLGSWYAHGQLGKRVAFFEMASAISSMFSGYLQSALYTGLNGHAGLAGWKWLFIFDALISIPIALWGFWAIPDLPFNTKAFWLKPEEREYGVARMKRIGRAAPKRLTLKEIKRVYTDWHIWAFWFPYTMIANAGIGASLFNLWLKAEKYSVVLTNTIPTAGSALQIILAMTWGTISDLTGQRMWTTITAAALTMVANIMLSIWYIPKGALWFAFFLSFCGNSLQPILIAWGQEMTQHDAAIRQLLVATGNIGSYVFSAWLAVVIFPTFDAPHYKYGYQILVMFGGLAIVGCLILGYLQKWELRTKKTRVTESGHTIVDNGEKDDEVVHEEANVVLPK